MNRYLIRMALKEDISRSGDLTTRYFLPARIRLRGKIVAHQSGIICGLDVAREVFRQVSRRIRFVPLVRDGQLVHAGRAIAKISGPREVLTAERAALNFLQRLSGVATLTREFADRLKGTRAKLYDTRKTLPGWRELEKYAVRCGGGFNHRMGLFDMVMLKDNHWVALGLTPKSKSVSIPICALSLMIRRFHAYYPKIPVLLEAKTRTEVKVAVDCGADIILLDNMSFSALRRNIRLIRSSSTKTMIEISGRVRLDNIRSIARLGPDRISVGAITHSAPALDMSLEIEHG